MKPDWKDAPEWAKWLAMDRDGEWYWYEFEPAIANDQWLQYGGRAADAGIADVRWDKSLEGRP
jgi:hypothetical protein